jgi:DNA-binding NarL/FixJ family response regulator
MEAFHYAGTRITVVVAVAVRLYREGLAATLNSHERLCVEGTAATPVEALAAVASLRPDVVVVDVSLDDVLSLMRALRSESSKTHILAIAVREEITRILDYAEAGADGFVTTNSSVPELVEAIERTATGELLCSPRIAAQLLRRAVHQRSSTFHPVGHILTGREQQVLWLLKQGRSNKQIAAALNIAPATAKNHVHHVLAKLQVPTRGQAMAAAAPLMPPALEPRIPSSTLDG